MLHRKWLERHYSDRNGSKWVQLKVGVAVDHFDLPDEARHACIENRFLLRSASTPTRATPARVGDPGAARKPAAQGRVICFRYPAFTSQCVRKSRAHTGSTHSLRSGQAMLGYYLSPLSGLVLRQSKGLTRTFNYTPISVHQRQRVFVKIESHIRGAKWQNRLMKN